MRLLFSALVAASLSHCAAAPSFAADEPVTKKSEKSTAKLGAKDVRKQWADLLARREKLMKVVPQIEDEFNAAKSLEEKQRVQAKFEKLRTEFETEINPGLLQLAPQVHQQDPTDPVAAQVLIGKLLPNETQETVPDRNYVEIMELLGGLTRTDKDSRAIVENILGILLRNWHHAQTAPLLDKLAAAKDASSRILTLAGMARFYESDFDKALELMVRAVAAPDVVPEAADFEQTCRDYVVFWKREQELRAAEARADDLPRVLLKTTRGDILLELFENEAPNTVANFIGLAAAGKYDRVKFHRVIPGFMAQGGDPNTLDDNPANDGQGGPGYTIPCECYTDQARMHFQGSLSMAHSGKDSGGSQFFITHAPTAHLNWSKGKRGSSHTVFGRVIKGLDVALELRQGDRIESAKIVRKRDHAYVPEKIASRPSGRK